MAARFLLAKSARRLMSHLRAMSGLASRLLTSRDLASQLRPPQTARPRGRSIPYQRRCVREDDSFADDNKNIREYCRAALEEEGYRVVLARDGVEALQVFCSEVPDLAILDISMPRAGGLDVLEQIHRLAPEIPAILYTAHDEDCLRDAARLLPRRAWKRAARIWAT